MDPELLDCEVWSQWDSSANDNECPELLKTIASLPTHELPQHLPPGTQYQHNSPSLAFFRPPADYYSREALFPLSQHPTFIDDQQNHVPDHHLPILEPGQPPNIEVYSIDSGLPQCSPLRYAHQDALLTSRPSLDYFCSPPAGLVEHPPIKNTRKKQPNIVVKASEACIGCRNKKIKCSGIIPCTQCQHDRTECEFSPRPKYVNLFLLF
ncbi:hypothetical protein V8F33_005245, partial [Rhypophila sp. PSN 637]